MARATLRPHVYRGSPRTIQRLRLVTQERMGVSAARNKGITVAHCDWLLFLDADDWLVPLHLERMTQATSARPDVDTVHCGWTRVAPDGTRMEETYGPDAEDLFPAFARRCAFSVHACMMRRSTVEDVGGFDTSLGCPAVMASAALTTHC